jgi:hypothetical protein
MCPGTEVVSEPILVRAVSSVVSKTDRASSSGCWLHFAAFPYLVAIVCNNCLHISVHSQMP